MKTFTTLATVLLVTACAGTQGTQQPAAGVSEERAREIAIAQAREIVEARGKEIADAAAREIAGQIAEAAIADFLDSNRRSGPQVGLNNDGQWGSWSEPRFCPPNEYVCGLRQKVEPNQGGGGDDTSMNAIAFFCCPLDPR